MPFKPGDICVTDVEYAADGFVITEIVNHEPPSCLVLSLKSRKIVHVSGAVLHKIGEVSPDLGILGVQALVLKKREPPSLDSPEFVRGRKRAEREEIEDVPENRARWAILAEAKPGKFLDVHLKKSTEVVTFHYVLERGKNYVFVAANRRGKLRRYSLDCLCLGNKKPS